MPDLRHAYHTLLCSPEQLALCREPHAVTGVLAVLRQLWGCADRSDAEMLQALQTLNRNTVPDEVAAGMAGIWLPRSYHVRSQTLDWCLPDGAPTEPFHDEYLSHCTQRITLNQLVKPRTSLRALAECAAAVPRARPAGFIFHLSRCGSTLLSGSLSELEGAVVFSESPVLTELLVDPALAPEEKRAHLQCLVDLKAAPFPGRRAVIKWNAWDLLHASLLLRAYPAVPVVALVRDPVEILASHHTQAGRHMSGDPSLAAVAPVFGAAAAPSVLEHRIRVLEALMDALSSLHSVVRVPCLDYRDWHGDTARQVAGMFGLRCDVHAQQRIALRTQYHAKQPGTRFEPDGVRKAAVFDAAAARTIAQRLHGRYEALASAPGRGTLRRTTHAEVSGAH